MDENNWFYNDGGKAVGPVTLADLRQMFAQGRLAPQTLVWHQSLVQWLAASQVSGLLAPRPPAPPQPSPAPQVPYVPLRPTAGHHGTAVAAFVLSIIALVLPCGGFVLAMPAIILAIVALSGMSSSQQQEGHGLAIAALIIGLIACACHGALFFDWMVHPHDLRLYRFHWADPWRSASL